MRLNDDKIKRDMLGEIPLPDCPSAIRKEAELILRMLYTHSGDISYNTMTELDKRLVAMYWVEFDDLNFYSISSPIKSIGEFQEWYVKKATSPDLISRARRWLVENRYIIVKTSVAERAQEAGDKWGKGMKQ